MEESESSQGGNYIYSPIFLICKNVFKITHIQHQVLGRELVLYATEKTNKHHEPTH